jgi:hypothetical protein
MGGIRVDGVFQEEFWQQGVLVAGVQMGGGL